MAAACGSGRRLVQIVQALADQHRHDVRLENRGIVRPAERLDDVRTEWPSKLHGVPTWDHELRKVHDDGHLAAARGFSGLDGLEVERPQQIPIDQFQRGAGLANERQGGRGDAVVGPQGLLEPRAPSSRPAWRARRGCDRSATPRRSRHTSLVKEHLQR